MSSELIFFHKGIYNNIVSALQEPGALKTAVNIDFKIEGEQGLRQVFSALNSTAINSIHSIRNGLGNVLVGDSTYLRWKPEGAGDFTSLGAAFANAIWTFREYNNFIIACNGTNSVLFDENGNLYNTNIPNPLTAPAGAAGDAGNPNGVYNLYVSYLITYPNGKTYETGISPSSADVTVTSQIISWSSIPVCPYVALSGTNPTIHRKLYRGPGTGGTLGDIYYVATIADNTTTTYSDDNSDSTIGANDPCAVDEYDAMPVFIHQDFHFGRWYGIRSGYENRLYYSNPAAGNNATENESLMPISFSENNWDDIKGSGFDGEVLPQGLVSWGAYLYIPLKHTWIRKYGEDSDTWSLKKSWAEYGISAPHTIDKCGNPAGILGLSNSLGGNVGISLFNGQTSQIITSPRLDYIFEEDINHNALEKCRGKWDGRYYHLLYPSGENTEPDKWLALDLKSFPDIKVAYWEDLNARCLHVDRQSKKVYIGGSDGFVRENTGTESINVEITTHDLIGGDPQGANREKTLKELKYSLDTEGETVDLEIYIDGILAKWPDGTTSKSISGTSKKIQYFRSFPPNWKGYRYELKITGTNLDSFKIYSPWDINFDVTK